MSISRLRFGHYRFLCRFEEDTTLPDFKGSMIRGALGMALKRVVCALRLESCEACMLAKSCLYVRMFEGAGQVNLSEGEGEPRISPSKFVPQAYVIKLPKDGKNIYKPGELFEFGLMLFGSLNESLPYIICAVREMGWTGIGRGAQGYRAKFELERVEQAVSGTAGEAFGGTERRHLVFDAGVGGASVGIEPEYLSLQDARVSTCETGDASSILTIRFLSPLRVKVDNHLSSELSFPVFIKTLNRRISSVFEAFAESRLEYDHKSLIDKASSVETVASELSWMDAERYSSRQQVKMKVGGLLGSISYAGDLTEFLPYIELASRLHIGKQTAFGLGEFEYGVCRRRHIR